jgi:2,3-dihydroxy-p-cumate/2,3-dihydroxybenzoate 3,4-dioxygenase
MIRYQKLGYVEINVSDVERSRRFYQDMVGLAPAGVGGDGGVWLRCSEDAYGVVLHQGDAPGLKRVGWMLEDERQFDNVYRALDGAGIAWEDLDPAECRARNLGRACRMVEPNTGATFEFYRPGPQAPDGPFEPKLTQIQRLGHVVFSTPNFEAAGAFTRDVLNFRQSDAIGDAVLFFRCFPNPYHHGMAFFRGAESKFNHINFLVSDIDDIGRAYNRMRRHQVPVVHGPGRHVPSGSIFVYFLDPDGITLEYSFGMEEFPEFGAREPRALPMQPEILDCWNAPPRDPRMGEVGAIESHPVARARVPA